MSTVLELEPTTSELSDDLLADIVGDTDKADQIGELMIDQSIAPTAGAIVALSRLANC
jgi:hypothetical protein